MFSLIRDIFISNFRRLKKPYKLTLSLTNRCNSRCINCYTWKQPLDHELTLREWEEFFKNNNYFKWIDITGGEIFLRRDLVDFFRIIILYSKRLELLHFPTNGLLTSTIVNSVKKIIALKPRKLIITISLDGPSDTNDFLRGVEGAWNKSIQTFIALRKIKGILTYLGITLCKYNYNQISQTLKDVQKVFPSLTFKDLHINIAHHSKHFYYIDRIPNMLDNNILKTAVDDFINMNGLRIHAIPLLEYIYLKKIKYYLANHKIPVKCQALSASLFINPQGDIYPCTIFSRKIANLRNINYKFLDIWNNNEITGLQKDIIKGECPGCWTPCEAYQSILGSILKGFK